MIETLDLVILIGAMALVAVISMLASWRERTRDDYFLAGRDLKWWLIGFSLIASNISTEHFVGMTGNAAQNGLGVASYEWLAAVALVFVAWWLLPHFLRAGTYTVPEFLEYRYDRLTRSMLAALMVVFFVLTVLATVLYSGALFLSSVLALPELLEQSWGVASESAENVAFLIGVWSIGVGAGIYTVTGGLRAVVWSDLIQGAGLLLGGLAVLLLALREIGDGEGMIAGWQAFTAAHADQLRVVMPADDPDLPWPALLTGMWIPVMFYWGLNQFITQRTLASGSLAEGQKGIMLAALIKLALPFLVVIPGMMAVPLLGDSLDPAAMDKAYPLLVRELLPVGLFGLMLAAITGSIMSTFNSGLNSAATVFTLDLWQTHVQPDLSERGAVRVGRLTTTALVIAACLWAPVIHSFEGVFQYIQVFWGFVSAPTCAIFFVGLRWRRVPASAAHFALIAGPLMYLISQGPQWIWTEAEGAAAGGIAGALYAYSSISFLYHLFVIFAVLVVILVTWGHLHPLPQPVTTPDRAVVDPQPWRHARGAGVAILVGTALLYALFW
ncbi:MAG: solute:sodium symporter family transporter [Planctomycetota bacterium]